MGTYWQDCITTLSWLAGLTERTHLLSHAYVLPYRHPLIAAKEFATLDYLSGGRAIVGIGAGHVEAEFAALGVDHARRGTLVEEKLPPLIEALEHEFVDGLGAQPRPVQSPRPPVWIAGSSAAAIRRAATYGDGWLPQGPSNAEMVAKLQAQRDEHGRADRPMMIGDITPFLYVGTPGWDVGEGVLSGAPGDIAERILGDTADGREPAPGAVQGPHLRRDLRPDGRLRHRSRAHPHDDLTTARSRDRSPTITSASTTSALSARCA